MSKGTSAAKRINNYEKLKSVFPERVEFYNEQIAELTALLEEIQACRRCGRPLKSDEATGKGYGKDCLAKMMEEATTE